MKSTLKRNILFFYGLIPGIAIGVGLSFLIFDISFHQEISVTQYENKAHTKEETVKQKQLIPKSSTDKKEKEKSKKEKGDIRISPDNDSIEGINEEYTDSLNYHQPLGITDTADYRNLPIDSYDYYIYTVITDTTFFDTLTIEMDEPDWEADKNISSDNNIVVMRDELIDVRSTIIEGIIKDSDRADSLIMVVGSGKDKNVYRVELWWSPVNFFGYKLAKNKIILFGINHNDSLIFRNVNDSILLKYRNNQYFLEKDEDFRQLMPLK